MTEVDQSEELAKMTVTSGKTKLSMEQVVSIQPGMSAWMMMIGERFWKCYHAGANRNRLLARYELSEGTKLLKQSLVTRPNYTEDMNKFLDEDLAKIRDCIDAEDWDHWDEVFEVLAKQVNHYHGVYNHGYLVWKVDPNPPGDLVLTPQED